MSFAVRVEQLSKRYRIGAEQPAYKTLRERLGSAVVAPLNRARAWVGGNGAGLYPSRTEIWALKDVSFDVRHGEVLGIIGRNGAGKSTLLKVLSRITEPTEGQALVSGRVGALLEVGTGFHPELTGRENIYLNGAILGMSRSDIERKFDEIVAFAELELFLDTPVKRYSSGMYMRLAFSVAAHLEPEILLVDEVLAVGDASFQRRCLGKMEDVAKQGRTVLFVSHNMAAVGNLTDRCVLLDGGRVATQGRTPEIIRMYLDSVSQQNGSENARVDLSSVRSRVGDQTVRLSFIGMTDQGGQATTTFIEGDPIDIEIGLRVPQRVSGVHVWYQVRSLDGVVLYQSNSGFRAGPLAVGEYRIRTRIEPNFLRAGAYLIYVKAHGVGWSLFDGVADAIRLHIEPGPSEFPLDRATGYFQFDYPWGDIEPLATCEASLA